MFGKDKKNQTEEKDNKNKPKMRQIIIETDGNLAKIAKAEVNGTLELKAILQGLSDSLK